MQKSFPYEIEIGELGREIRLPGKRRNKNGEQPSRSPDFYRIAVLHAAESVSILRTRLRGFHE
jgi:hypothetical protein